MAIELLEQVRVIDPVKGTDRQLDILINEGQLRAIAPKLTDIPAEATRLDCRGKVLGPGLVDLYSHSGEPGNESRETLASLIQAAEAGGFTRLHLLPDTQPALDCPATVSWLQTQLRNVSSPKIQLWGAITQGAQGQHLTELAELADAGVVGFTDGKPIGNLTLLRNVLEYLQPLGLPIALWPMDRGLTGHGIAREGSTALRFGLPGVPVLAEAVPLAAILELVGAIGTPVHLLRLSTARGLELVAAAKAQGLPITASTTWQHLLLDTSDLQEYDPTLHLAPPLGNQADRQALVQAVKTGVIDAIAIDHAAYTYEETTVAFAEAPTGAIGLELALPLLWRGLVETGVLTGVELWRALSSRSAACLGQTVGPMEPGQRELTLFDPNDQWLVNAASLKSLSDNTHWLGQPISGRVVRTWCS
jgi:dihydroorotase